MLHVLKSRVLIWGGGDSAPSCWIFCICPSLLRSRSGQSHITLPVPTQLLQTDIHSFLGNKPINVWLSFSCECSRLWLVQRIQWQLKTKANKNAKHRERNICRFEAAAWRRGALRDSGPSGCEGDYLLSRMVYFRPNKPITLSTWNLTLAMPLVRSTSTGSNCGFPLVNAGITNLACFSPTLSQIVNPRSAMTMSPGSRFSKNPQF